MEDELAARGHGVDLLGGALKANAPLIEGGDQVNPYLDWGSQVVQASACRTGKENRR